MYNIIYFLAGVVCAQNGTTVSIEFGCEGYGDAELCQGRITGECNCYRIPTVLPTGTINPTAFPTTMNPTMNPTAFPTTMNPTMNPTAFPTTMNPSTEPTTNNGRCLEGAQRCVSECNCGDGYYECVDGVWINRPLPCIILLYNSWCNLFTI